MFPCTWKPQGRCSCNGCILLQDIFCHLQTAHYFTVRFDHLASTVNGWSSPHTVGLVSVIIGNFGWSAAQKHICQTHLLPFTSHSSCHVFFAACFMCRLPQVFYLWTVRCWHQIAFQMFPEECILSAVVSAVGRHVSRAIPKLALIPAAFKSSLSLVGQNWLSMGHLTAGMLSVQFPTPRQYWDFLEVLFSVGWPLT